MTSGVSVLVSGLRGHLVWKILSTSAHPAGFCWARGDVPVLYHTFGILRTCDQLPTDDAGDHMTEGYRASAASHLESLIMPTDR